MKDLGCDHFFFVFPKGQWGLGKNKPQVVLLKKQKYEGISPTEGIRRNATGPVVIPSLRGAQKLSQYVTVFIDQFR